MRKRPRACRTSLCAFERIELEPGQSRQVSVRIAPRAMELVTEEGERVIEPGEFTLFCRPDAPDDRSARADRRAPAFRTL